MKNSEVKKQGLLTRLKTAFSEEERFKHDLIPSKQEAQILCTRLSSWGVNANIMEGLGTTAAIVVIAGSPIHWINVSHVHDYTYEFMRDYYVYEFIAPDPRHLLKLEVKAAPVRKWGWITGGYGKLIDIRWKGNDHGAGISRDQEIRIAIMNLINKLGRPKTDDHGQDFIHILTRPDISCWVIKPMDIYFFLRQEHWYAFESIAQRLLAMDIPK